MPLLILIRSLKAKVIVVGAGPAGLGAARQLSNFGIKVRKSKMKQQFIFFLLFFMLTWSLLKLNTIITVLQVSTFSISYFAIYLLLYLVWSFFFVFNVVFELLLTLWLTNSYTRVSFSSRDPTALMRLPATNYIPNTVPFQPHLYKLICNFR